MSAIGTILNGSANFDFAPTWKRSLPISLALAVVSLVLILTVGLNRSIDFEGGGIFEVPVDDSVQVEDARSAISDATARIQRVDDPDGGTFIRVQTGVEALGTSSELVDELAVLGGVTADDVSINEVGPTWGDQITEKAVEALVFFFIAVLFYLSVRLEWRMGVGAVVAVVHDLLIIAGLYAAFRFEVSPATVIALLTIMGYSLYDTVVVFDKVLEKAEEAGAMADGYTALVSRSMNQVLMRSINTTITTVLPVASMLIIGSVLLGGATLRDFALALFIGLLLGTYSSIFVAAPVLAMLKERDPEIAAEREKRERRIARKAKR
jgi:preprotein translocase subunit SecF